MRIELEVYLGRKCQIFDPRLVKSLCESRSLGNLSEDCRIYRVADFCSIRVTQGPMKWVGGNSNNISEQSREMSCCLAS